MKQKSDYKRLHIALIIIGSIFILLSAFHTEVWYDEGFTVSLLNHSYADIWRIGAADVHPVLYYFILKTVALIFGHNILVYRIMSGVPGIIMGVLGYTHIRKNFGAKTGILFSFLTFFLPFMAMYSVEIRMYTWTMLFVTLTSIYAYRIISKYNGNIENKNENNNETIKNKVKIKKNQYIKNWILFAVFSVLSAYCHYYGLMFAVVINAFLLLYLILANKGKNEEKLKNKKKNLITYAIVGTIQILLYLPWLFVFFEQLSSVSKSYWIVFEFPYSLFGPIGVQFNGRLDMWLTITFSILMYMYLIYMIFDSKKRKIKLGIPMTTLGIHFAIYLIALIVTIVKAPVLYYRYMLVTSGLLIFAFSYLMAKQWEETERDKKENIEKIEMEEEKQNEKMQSMRNTKKIRKIVLGTVCTIILALSIYNNALIIRENYHYSNKQEINYLKENVKDGDLILFRDVFLGTKITAQAPELKQAMYRIDGDRDNTFFETFMPALEMIFDKSELDDFHGRIFLIDDENGSFYNDLKSEISLKEIERQHFHIYYRWQGYEIITVEKK